MHDVTVIKKDVKNITLKVKPCGSVSLTAPKFASDAHIKHIIDKKSKWIDRKKDFFAKFQKQQKEYVSGEDFEYLGKRYRLKVITSKEQKVKLQRGYLQLFVRDANDITSKQKLIYEWYYEKAIFHFFHVLHEYNKLVQKDISEVKVRQMKTRWGSCNAHKSMINLNIELIKKPKECIEYVVFHELSHLIYPNHSQDFYDFLTLHMPDWSKRKDRLNKPFL